MRVSGKWSALAVVALAAAACLPEGVHLPGGSVLDFFEQKSGRIAFVGVDGNIHTIDQGGVQQVDLTSDARNVPDAAGRLVRYDLPTWSPVDRRLAFLKEIAIQGGALTSSVLVAAEDGGEIIEVYHSETDGPIYLYWAPDGQKIGFLTGGVGGDPLNLRVAMAGGGEVRVIDSGRPYYWAWSPDDQSIFAHVGGTAFATPGQARLTFLRLDETITQIGLGVEPGLFQAPAYSPDGQFLVFASALESGAQGLMLADPAGSVRTVLAELPGAVAFGWAPVGNKVAYIASREPDQILPGDLYFLDLADPDHPVQIETQAHGVVSFSWAPDGQRVAYLVPVIYTPPDTQARSDASIHEILLGLYVADSKDGSTQLLWTFRPSQEMLQIIPFFDQYQRSATIWSPDGNYLVVSALMPSQAEGIFLVPSHGNQDPRFLVDGRLAFWSRK